MNACMSVKKNGRLLPVSVCVMLSIVGDAEGAKFRKIGDTGRTLLQEGGFFSLYRGAVWRCGRQIGAVFLLDKVRTTLSPVVFPGKFKEVEV